LKHQSQFLLQKLSTTEISLDELEAVGNAGPNTEASASELQQIDHLKQVISCKLDWLNSQALIVIRSFG
jgi:hypothetical protein